jgi:tetratricopeptide (TPR) repeat protein
LFYLLTATLQIDEGILELRKAVETDPLSSYAACCFALGLSVAGEINESIEWASRAVKLDPDSLISRYTLGFCYQWADEISKSIEQYQIGTAMSDRHAWQLGLLLQAYLKAGKPDLAQAIYDEMDQRYQDQYMPPSILAQSAAAIGDEKRALKLAHEAVDIIDPYLSNIITNYPEAKALRSLPGFEDIVKKFGYGVVNQD